MIALVTGASSGIGRDIAIELAKRKYDIIAVARNEKALNDLKSDVEKEYNINVDVSPMDLVDRDGCVQLHKEVKEKYGCVDVLVNDAGFGACGDFTETDLDKELGMIDTNIVAYHVLTKLYLQDMKQKNSGKILNVASIAGFMPGPLMATYYSTKAYVVRLSEAIREELRREKSNVQISILCPGPVNTNFNKVAHGEFAINEISPKYVAKLGIDKMFKKKMLIVPTFKMKLTLFFSRFAPLRLQLIIAYHIQGRKLGKK